MPMTSSDVAMADPNAQNIIITSLPNGDAVRKVFIDHTTGLLAASAPREGKRLYLDTSTIEVSTSLEVLKQVEESGHCHFLDAPVSGGIPSAIEGKLVFMVGGPEDVFEHSKEILNLMGTKLFYCGKPGAGLATKQINNYIAYCSFIGLCEGLFIPHPI